MRIPKQLIPCPQLQSRNIPCLNLQAGFSRLKPVLATNWQRAFLILRCLRGVASDSYFNLPQYLFPSKQAPVQRFTGPIQLVYINWFAPETYASKYRRNSGRHPCATLCHEVGRAAWSINCA